MTCTAYQVSYDRGRWWLFCTDEGEVYDAEPVGSQEEGIELAHERGATSLDVFNQDGSWHSTSARVAMKGQ